MSDGQIRLCKQHRAELRLIGADWICPYGRGASGHAVAEGEWELKRSGLPWADPRVRKCPIHGKRLMGMGDVLRCEEYEHDVSTMPSDRPDPAAASPVDQMRAAIARARTLRDEMPEPVRDPVIKAGRRLAETVSESAEAAKERVMAKGRKKAGSRKKPIQHGTPNGYWNGCRLDCCRTAVMAYLRERKGRTAERKGTARTERKGRVIGALARVATQVLDVEVVNASNVMAALDRANEALRKAEADFAAAMSARLRFYQVVPL